MKNKRKLLITEISEEDFRKLDITVYRQEKVYKDNSWHLEFVPKKINDILDENIEYWIESGYEEDLEDLKQPVTVAIHVANGPDPHDYYFDKFMNMYSYPGTYEIGMGIRHIYLTRDYAEDHDDYWKVKKDETKVIYRVHLDEKWLKKFVLKHKIEKEVIDSEHWIEREYNFDKKTGKWTLSFAYKCEKYGEGTLRKKLDTDLKQ